jgi:hypothetical protein
MYSHRRIFYTVLAVVAWASGPLQAQTFTLTPLAPSAAASTDVAAPESAVRMASDYATDVLGDPWDFEQAGDYVYMFSEDPANPALSSWASLPTVANGRFLGTPRVSGPRLQLISEGVDGALNVVGRNGVHFPIDTSKYKRLSFRMRRSVMPTSGSAEVMEAVWFTQSNRNAGTMGLTFFLVRGYGGGSTNRYHNQSPVSPVNEQGSTGWHIYKVDLDGWQPAGGGPTWTDQAQIRGLRLALGNASSIIGSTVEIDWVRLTERGTALAQLSFTGFGGPVTVTARHVQTNDIIQVFPDNGTSATTFPNNSQFVWDYGFLSPGTWEVTATDGSKSVKSTLDVDPAPVLDVLDPDAKGGRDYGRSIVGDAYDMTNPQDILRDGKTGELNGVAFGEGGMTATTFGNSTTPLPDPHLYLLDDSTRRPGTERTLDASTYRHLTFTVEYDRKDLTFYPALLPDYGGIMRVIWRAAGKNGAPLTNTQDIFVLDGGPSTYSMDLGSFTQFDNCATCTLEPTEGRDLWQGLISTLRVDPYESNAQRWFRFADVRIAADDEPNANGFFQVKWSVADATFSREVSGPATPGSDATVTLYYDTDTIPTNGRVLIASGIAASAGSYNWNVAGLAPGRYFVQAVITDSAGNSQARYSGGPVRIATIFLPLTDSSGTGMPDAWRARYELSDPLDDADGDGVSNVDEFRQSTNPLVPNTWMLPEGATGFFREKIALANPDPTPANVTLTFLRKAPPGQPLPAPIVRDFTVLGYGRLTVTANDVGGLGSEEFSTVVTSTTGGVVAERTMSWGDFSYGGHTGKAVKAPRTRWYFAEGDANFFDTWILLANASSQTAAVTITYLLPGGGTIVRQYTVDPNSRYTVYANQVPGLAGKSFSGDISSNVPITVERAMYFSSDGRFWNGGHVAAAVEAPAVEWFVAEGRTGPFFDTFLLLANPSAQAAQVTTRLLLPGGVYRDVTKPLLPFSRENLWLDVELANLGFPDTDVSARVTSTNGVPIIVERAMYWPEVWAEAHASAGVTQTGTLWALADGELGGSLSYDTYILFANPNATDAIVKVKVLRASGTPTDFQFVVPANSRATQQASMIGAVAGEQFGLLVESINDIPIVVERAMYWNGGGQFWGGGTNETAVRLR